MKDEVDVFLSHRIKNWVSRENASDEVRELLLGRAASSIDSSDRFSVRLLLESHLIHQIASLAWGEGLFKPFTQSRTWSYHMAISFHFVT